MLFINDIDQVVRNFNILLFADDLKIYKDIRSYEDCVLLQEDIEKVGVWCETNLMEVNTKKCFIISFSRNTTAVDYQYSLFHHKVSRVSKIKDLGVMMDQKLTFTEHVQLVSCKSYKILGFINRHLKEFPIDTFKLAYISLVRSILEYNCTVWSPFYQINIKTLEGVQNKFLRICSSKLGIGHQGYQYNYQELRKVLKLDSLELRRTKNDLMFLHHLISGEIDCSLLLEKFKLRCPSRSTRNHPVFKVDFHKTNYGFFSPIARLSRLANTYNDEVELFGTSRNRFKSQLKTSKLL